MEFNRRNLFRMAGVAGGAALLPRKAEADMAVAAGERTDGYAILVDLSRCVGCRTCEAACAEANGLPEPDWSDDFSYESERSTSETQWTAVNRYETSKGEVFVKRQCMHCLQPACAAGCLTKALYKTEEGPVIWREDKCMGCRFCMVSCPFDAPKFEYHSAVPKIQKCRMCWERLAEGETPACVENCPGEALAFGRRSEMLKLARERIVQNPETYVDHIYGEHEAGGTGVLYISPVPFEELGFRTDLDREAYPEKTRDFLTAVPVVLVLWPAMMLALRRAGDREEEEPGAATGSDGAEEV
ncbi:MAG: 4Fe-4S dicluster domain-containing protein [Acidobacteriota bacterium]|jgi:Fe-S-cluster-containing dehydrogenase component